MAQTTNQVDLMPLVDVMQALLTPETGCPWDQEQTHQSLRKHVIEEAHEVAEAIDAGKSAHLCEELGDLLYQIVFHAALAERAGDFTLQDVINAITGKMIRRHPHVFHKGEVAEGDIARSWEEIKRTEEPGEVFVMRKLPPDLPALMKAQKFFAKARRVGCPLAPEVLLNGKNPMITCLTKSLDTELDAEQTLNRAVEAAMARFRQLELLAGESGKSLADMDEGTWQSLWDEAGNTLEK